ncbi:hypothetical protein PLESTB_000568600 [Pleodorina starrii]|uniref:OTU domain-containing protein n=1 Tax=Pleodorina starrii TaxID=330485 RepID=A0A9W6BGV5_9CHLO|nr:hypothetical protein PLESTB_000568600 [Pleodorina starrii]
MNLSLCLRGKAVDVVKPGDDVPLPPPVVPEDAAQRGRAAELHGQISYMNKPILVPRDQLVINFDFDDLIPQDGPPSPGPRRPLLPEAPQGQTRPSVAWADGGGAAVAAAPAGPDGGEEAGSGGAAATTAAAASPFATDADAAAAAAAMAAEGAGAAASAGTPPPRASFDVGAAAAAAAASSGVPLSPRAEGQGPHARGFVRVKSVRPPEGLSWTHSRKCLEVLIAAERGNGGGGGGGGTRGGSGYLSHEQRLRERLERLNLEMLIVAGDGNCQFRSISNELYGTQDHHASIRRQAVGHILAQREAFEAFLGEDFDQYVRQMERGGTWGDELTLRAVCDSFGLTIHVVTSDQEHWYLTYQPESRKLDREIFLTYIAPIHYNSIRRRSSLKTMALSVSRSIKKIGSGRMSLGSGTISVGNGSCSGPASPTGGAGGGDAVSPVGCRASGGSSGGGRARRSNGGDEEEDGGGDGGCGGAVRLRLRTSRDESGGGGGGEGGGGESGGLLRAFRGGSP